MPAISKTILFERFENGVRAGGWRWLRLGTGNSPREYQVWRDEEVLRLKVYLWTLTHGGTGRAADEWRIQPTGLAQFIGSPGWLTVILGYEPTRDVFAGFSYAAHSGGLGTSPSIQIKAQALNAAIDDGIVAHTKINEVVFALRPELLPVYVKNLEALHESGSHSADLKLLSDMASDPDTITPDDIDAEVTQPSRRKVLKTVLRTLRDGQFRKRVLGAYSHECAACGVQLNLLDAAHILPVGHPNSTDKVTNGVALCALHHRAYDGALITFGPDFKLHISEDRIAVLKVEGRHSGLDLFRKALSPVLKLPSAVSQHPSPAMIKKANIYRGWSL